MAMIQPITQPARWVVSLAGEVECDGITLVGELTGVNPDYVATFGEGDVAFAEAVQAVAALFPPLPDAGWLEQGAIYRYDGQAVIVRQSHDRGAYNGDPGTYLTLWLVYRPDAADVLEWIVGEQVWIGTRRTFGGATYRAIQDHVTQADWTPPVAIDVLWAVVAEEPPPGPAAWAAGVYPLDALVTHLGRVWKSLMAANGYEPSKVGTWRDQSDPPMWVAPAGAIGLWNLDDTATHAGKTWRCTANGNAFAPGVWGWVQI